jgi:hypothetical protein
MRADHQQQPQMIFSPNRTLHHNQSIHRHRRTFLIQGHEAGYEWAEENDIDDPDDCGGNSDSFIEGCQAYAEERQTFRTTEEHDDDEYPMRF